MRAMRREDRHPMTINDNRGASDGLFDEGGEETGEKGSGGEENRPITTQLEVEEAEWD